MKKIFLFWILLCGCLTEFVYGQNKENVFYRDTLLTIAAKPEAGFQSPYLLFIPSGTVKNESTFLLVEPNNTGRTSDSLQVHLEAAKVLASRSSVGNNISSELKIPMLVPVFPRPSSQALVYTHALDRDVMKEDLKGLERLDLQLLAIVKDANETLKSLGLSVEEKIFMSGFSASATFVNRFAFMHPERIAAIATGGLNGILMLPLPEINGVKLNYPLGIADLYTLTGKPFTREAYLKITQFIYMGALDNNDAVKFDDAYSEEERRLIYANLGEAMQPERWEKCQKIYLAEGANATFTTYEGVGHGTTSEMNLAIIKFFAAQIGKSYN